MTRPPNTPPALAYEYRRHILIIRALALGKNEGRTLTDLRALAEGWGLDYGGTFSELVQRLCEAAIDYQRQEPHDDHANT